MLHIAIEYLSGKGSGQIILVIIAVLDIREQDQ